MCSPLGSTHQSQVGNIFKSKSLDLGKLKMVPIQAYPTSYWLFHLSTNSPFGDVLWFLHTKEYLTWEICSWHTKSTSWGLTKIMLQQSKYKWTLEIPKQSIHVTFLSNINILFASRFLWTWDVPQSTQVDMSWKTYLRI